jgi:hypothetical protein
MHSREERLALNEVLFRKANERIQAAAEHHAVPDVPIGFYCECGDRDCTEQLVITANEFETVRTRPTQFIVRPGHELPEIETVITRTPLYLVVEKTGEAAEIAKEALDET